MADVFRIVDRVQTTGRETVYTIQLSKGAILKAGDFLHDLHGNTCKVKGEESIASCEGHMSSSGEMPTGFLLEMMYGTDIMGNILVRDRKKLHFLFCNHPLYPRKVDEDYEEEYQAACLHHTCALFSYEDMMEGRLTLYGEEISGLTIYRGWMMKPDMYRTFYDALEQSGIYLINTPEEYERYHLLPGWYDGFKEETAASVWTTGNHLEDVMDVSKSLEGSYIIKDYVKSRKHEWYDACFVKDIQDRKNLERVANNFITRQGEDLVDGVVLRKFETLKSIGFHEQSGMPLSEEYRIFVYAGRILTIDDYWMKHADISISAEEYAWIASIAAKVRSNFVTIDVARKTDGSLIIMELGDGQVSGLQQVKAEVFYDTFSYSAICNPFTIEEIKQVITTYTRLDIELEMTLTFRDKPGEYMIIGYISNVSFLRCGNAGEYDEHEYPSVDALFEAQLMDGICLNRDWYKVTEVSCVPDFREGDIVMETYRKAFEKRNMRLGDRYRIYRAVKTAVDKWNPYALLPDAPADEFDGESERIANRIGHDSSIDTIASVVSRVFFKAFNDRTFTVEACMGVATEIKKALDRDRDKGAGL